jgi:hypothetical protein
MIDRYLPNLEVPACRNEDIMRGVRDIWQDLCLVERLGTLPIKTQCRATLDALAKSYPSLAAQLIREGWTHGNE